MRDNPYPGINAHLNSLLQTPGTDDQPAVWPAFHSQHIANLTEALNAQLPDHYLALNQQSLQTRSVEIGGFMELRRPVPDVSIFQKGQPGSQTEPALAATPTWEASIADVLEPVPQPQAAVIHELLPQGKLGRVVTRIELLSPSNKPGGSHYETYAVKRVEALQGDVPLIEIDYLHESSPVISQLPAYPHHPLSYPYAILISDPRPDWGTGKVRVYGFSVTEPIKVFPVPLAGDESILLDLNAVYQHTFRAGRWGDLLDYQTGPERAETYRPQDREYIRLVMARL